jgi:isoleucyl-tRNA synthetase
LFLPQIRGTLRFVLGNLHGFDPAKHSVPYDQLPALDKYMLSRLAAFQGEVGGVVNIDCGQQ